MKGALLALAALFLLGGCGKKSTEDLSPEKGPLRFKYAPLAGGWEKSSMEGMQLAFYRKDLGATIAVATQCKNIEDVSQASLLQQELIGVPHRKVVSQSQAKVSGRDAEDWIVDGNLDGVEMRLELIVLRHGKCVYDINLIAKPDSFPTAQTDFKAFLDGFTVVK